MVKNDAIELKVSNDTGSIGSKRFENQYAAQLRWSNITYDVDISEEERTKIKEVAAKKYNNDISQVLSIDNANFINVNKEGTEKKRILHNISGYVGDKEMLAIMGPSGSGKTSLLNILADRAGKNGISGNVYYNELSEIPSLYKRITGYVTQGELWFEALTVRETLLFTARLKCKENVPLHVINEKIDKLAESLDMNDCINNIIMVKLVKVLVVVKDVDYH